MYETVVMGFSNDLFILAYFIMQSHLKIFQLSRSIPKRLEREIWLLCDVISETEDIVHENGWRENKSHHIPPDLL